MENLQIEDNTIIELVSATHNPDGRDFDINVVLNVAESILNFETVSQFFLLQLYIILICVNYCM